MIDFVNVSMAYSPGAPLALKNVSFHIDRGEFVFLIGESGSGKSTIVKLLTCEERPTDGEVVLSGYSLNSIKRKQVPYLRRNIGMVFQDFRLINTKTVFENVAFAMEIVGAGNREIKRQVPLVLSTVGLRHKADTRPLELSGGEQQRVAIARAMVNNPMMILADEPTGNLDPVNSEGIMALLQEINRGGTTVVVCTHDRDMVDRMQRRTIEIQDGQIVRDDAAGLYETDVQADPKIQELLVRREAQMRPTESVRSQIWGRHFHRQPQFDEDGADERPKQRRVRPDQRPDQ